MKNMFKAETPYNEIEENTSTIFESAEIRNLAETFSTKFTEGDEGLNPLTFESQVNTDFEIENLINEHCAEEEAKNEKLKRSTILTYFGVKDKDIKDFKEDLFLPLTDYSFFMATKKTEDDEKKESI